MDKPARLIDADSHVLEPDSLWDNYIDKRFRDRAPKPPPAGSGPPGAAPSWFGELLFRGEKVSDRVSPELGVRAALHVMKHYPESVRAGFDAKSHVACLRRAGFERTFLYPTMGLWLFAIDSMEADLAGALVRAYNDWLYDYCGTDRTFLNGVGAVNQHDPAEMVEEVRRIKGFGWKAVYVRPNPIKGRILSHPDYEPFWSECERLGISVSVHEGTHALSPTTGSDRFETRFARHACSHPMEQMMALLALIEGGVLERHPSLRVAFLESGCGWVPYWLLRLDEEHHALSWEVKKNVPRLPSEYFRRQCFVGCEASETYLPKMLDLIGEDNLLFGSDYPHIDHTPAALGELFATANEVPQGVMTKILYTSPLRYYDADSEA